LVKKKKVQAHRKSQDIQRVHEHDDPELDQTSKSSPQSGKGAHSEDIDQLEGK
jgi:hypothetical protein